MPDAVRTGRRECRNSYVDFQTLAFQSVFDFYSTDLPVPATSLEVVGVDVATPGLW